MLQAFFKMYHAWNLIIRKMKNQKLFNIIQKFFSDYANVHIFPKCFPKCFPFVSIFTFNSYAVKKNPKVKYSKYFLPPPHCGGGEGLKLSYLNFGFFLTP